MYNAEDSLSYSLLHLMDCFVLLYLLCNAAMQSEIDEKFRAIHLNDEYTTTINDSSTVSCRVLGQDNLL